MAQTKNLGLYLIEEGEIVSATPINENFEIMSASLKADLEPIQTGKILSSNLINTNFQIIDDNWPTNSSSNGTSWTLSNITESNSDYLYVIYEKRSQSFFAL